MAENEKQELSRAMAKAQDEIIDICRRFDRCDECAVDGVCLNSRRSYADGAYCFESTPDLWPKSGEDCFEEMYDV